MYFNSEIKNMLIVKSYNQIKVCTNCTFRIISLCQVSSHLPWYRPIQETTNFIMVTTGTTEIYERANWIPSTKTYRTEREPGAQSNESNWLQMETARSVLIAFVCFSTASENGWGGMSSAFHCLHSCSFHMNNRLQTKTSVCLAGVKQYARKVKKVCWEGYCLYFTSQIWCAQAIKCEIICLWRG